MERRSDRLDVRNLPRQSLGHAFCRSSVHGACVQLEEFRKKKDKTPHAATVVLELENGTAEEENRPDPNMWRRALEVSV
jgi:hypothetical protein